MHLNRLERAIPDGTCHAGKVFYSCQINGFRGCCSVDPCALPACPDSDYISTTVPVSKSTSQPTTRQTLISIPNSLLSSTTATATTPPTSIIVDISITPTSPAYTQTEAQSRTSSPASTSTPKSSPTGVPNTPIIAGTVSGVVVLSILSILIWFCFRRRKQKQESRKSIAHCGLPNKEFVLDRSAPSDSSRVDGDVFAPFGGRYDQHHLKSPPSATHPPRGTHSTSRPAPTSSHGIYQAPAVGYESGNPDPTTPITDRAVPDPEKSALAPPPVHDHPFFHPLPGQSAEIPTYHPGTLVHTNLTPIAPQKSTMRSHPTYHISQLSAHPAFRASKSPSPPRESGFPRRTSEVRKYRSLSPVQNSPRNHPENHNSSQTYQEPKQSQDHGQNQHAGWSSELSRNATSTVTSPIVGRSELEADVPSTYLSPVTTYNTPSDFDYTNKWTDRRSQMTPISRENTDSSKYSIPIGLGVDSIPGIHYSQGPEYGNQGPSETNPDRHYQHHSELESPKQNHDTSVNSTTPSLSISTQMLGPIGPNLNSLRDGGHILSWAGNHSNSRPSHSHSQHNLNHAFSSTNHTNPTSIPTSRSQPHLRGGSDEKEVIISPLSPERWSGATAVQTQSPLDGTNLRTDTDRRVGAYRGGETPVSPECHSACCQSGVSPEAGTGTWGSWSGR